MAVSEQQFAEHIHIEDDTENGEFDMESIDSDDQNDPTFDIVEDTRSGFSRLSIKKKWKSRISRDQDTGSVVDPDEVEIVVPELDEKDKKSFENIQNIIQAGQQGKLKVDQCKVYLRKYGLRLTGNKDTLIQRISEHLKISDGGGEKKYPVSSFVLNCKGDACTGDIVMFEQNVYDMFNIASRSASGPPCGTRIVAGRIVKESYGAAKQQHTFTIEVLWSKGEKPHPPLHPLLIKGRNLYRLKTLRQRWEDEGERQKALMEKHSRGSLARTDREARMQEKEMRKKLKTDRVIRKAEPNEYQSHQFRKEEPSKNQTQVKNSAKDLGKPAMRVQQMQPFQSHQEQIYQPQSHPIMTGSRSSSTQKENIGLPHTSTKPFNSSTTEKLCSGSNTIQHREKEFHHASQRQPLTSMDQYPPVSSTNHFPPLSPTRQQNFHPSMNQITNHFSSLSPTRRQNHYPSMNHFPPLSPTRRQSHYPSMNHFPPLSPTRRQSLYPASNQSTTHFPPLSPTRRQSHYPSSNQSMNHFPPLSPTRRQGKYPPTNQSTNHFPPLSPARRPKSHYPSMNQWQKQGELQQQQPCRYYAQGRCYFGDNCKFSHELAPEKGGGQKRGEFWY